MTNTLKELKWTAIDQQHAKILFCQLSGYLYNTPTIEGKSVCFVLDGSEDKALLNRLMQEAMAFEDNDD